MLLKKRPIWFDELVDFVSLVVNRISFNQFLVDSIILMHWYIGIRVVQLFFLIKKEKNKKEKTWKGNVKCEVLIGKSGCGRVCKAYHIMSIIEEVRTWMN